jgi:spermidine/putrescine transport system permease protein
MIGNVIQAKFLESLDYPTAASLSFILMGTILIMLLIYAKVVGSEKLTG